jgi:hypothetical protein
MTTEKTEDKLSPPATKFRLTFDQAKADPGRRDPAFPPYCVECCQPATTSSQVYERLKKDSGRKDRRLRVIYDTIEITARIPWCRRHKLEHIKRRAIFIFSGVVALVLPFAGLIIYAQDLDFWGVAWRIGVGLVAGLVLTMVLTSVLSKLLRVKGPWQSFGVDISGPGDSRWVEIDFANPEYAKQFADANDWQVVD